MAHYGILMTFFDIHAKTHHPSVRHVS